MSFSELAASIQASDDTTRALDLGRPVWVYGTGSFGRAVAAALRAKGVQVPGFVATKPPAESCDGLPILPIAVGPGALGQGAQVAVGIFNRETSYGDIDSIARAAGIERLFWPFDYYPQVEDQLGWKFWLGSTTIAKAEIDRIRQAYEMLSDERSRTLFSRIIRFRAGQDLAYAAHVDPEEQYFCDLTLPHLANRSFCYVDCGAFDGDSYVALNQHVPVADAYLFEPDTRNYAALVANVRGFSGAAKCLPLAVADTYEILSFSGEGEGGVVDRGGTTRIATVKLDDMLSNTRIDLLKLDIEGSEAMALRGARRLIAEGRPIICASLYHKPEDVWDLLLLIASIVDDYDYYIRQHMFNTFESVLYAVPRRR